MMPKITESSYESRSKVSSPMKVERVKEDNNILKVTLNKLRNELAVFKADRVKYEEEILKKDKLIEEISNKDENNLKAKEVGR